MSVRALGAAWRVDCEPMQKLLLLALADHANDETFDCWPSLTHLCKKTGFVRSTVAKLLKGLEAAQMIEREQRINQSTRYVLNVARWSATRTSPPHALVRHTDGGSPPHGHQVVRHTDHKHKINHQGTVNLLGHAPENGGTTPFTPAKTYPPEFEATWVAYPKRAGGNSKADAFKAWRARRKAGVLAEELHAGVVRYGRFLQASGKAGSEYVKQAATFFGPAEHWREPWTVNLVLAGQVGTAAEGDW